MNPIHRRPLMTAATLLFVTVVMLAFIVIGLYVRDNNRRLGGVLDLNGQIECHESGH